MCTHPVQEVGILDDGGEESRMKMADIKVSMRLVSKLGGAFSPITVTELTERGFKYALDEDKPFIACEGSYFPKEGHEHFGLDGEAFYELEEGEVARKEHRGFFVLSPKILAKQLPLPKGTKITGARWDEMTRRILVFVEHPDLVESYEGLPVQESHVLVTEQTREALPGDMITTCLAEWN